MKRRLELPGQLWSFHRPGTPGQLSGSSRTQGPCPRKGCGAYTWDGAGTGLSLKAGNPPHVPVTPAPRPASEKPGAALGFCSLKVSPRHHPACSQGLPGAAWGPVSVSAVRFGQRVLRPPVAALCWPQGLLGAGPANQTSRRWLCLKPLSGLGNAGSGARRAELEGAGAGVRPGSSLTPWAAQPRARCPTDTKQRPLSSQVVAVCIRVFHNTQNIA